MSNIVKATLAAIALSISTSAFAWGITWESFASYSNNTLEPVDSYSIEVNGNNLRVYEWITRTTPHQKCIFVASESGVTLQCDIVTKQMTEE